VLEALAIARSSRVGTSTSCREYYTSSVKNGQASGWGRVSKNDDQSPMVSGRAAAPGAGGCGHAGFVAADSVFVGAHRRRPYFLCVALAPHVPRMGHTYPVWGTRTPYGAHIPRMGHTYPV